MFSPARLAIAALVAAAPLLAQTSATDKAAFATRVDSLVKAYMAETVVSPESFARMSTAATLNDGQKIRYGFGLVPGEMSGHAFINHSGGIPGFATMEYYFPADSLAVVVFTNYDSASPNVLAGNIARIVYGLPPQAAGRRGGGS